MEIIMSFSEKNPVTGKDDFFLLFSNWNDKIFIQEMKLSQCCLRLDCLSIRSDEGLTLKTPAFRIPVRWPIYIINYVDKTIFLYTTSPPTQHQSFFRNYSLHSLVTVDCFG